MMKGTTREQPDGRDAQCRVTWEGQGASVPSPDTSPTQHLHVLTNPKLSERLRLEFVLWQLYYTGMTESLTGRW